MRDLIASVEFWIAVAFAAVVKMRASENLTPRSAAITVVSAVLAAAVFTEPLLAFLDWDSSVYRNAVVALVALTGEEFARQILKLDLKQIVELWRGKK